LFWIQLRLPTVLIQPQGEAGGFIAVQLMWQGVDVMVTIFCNFCQFSAKKLAFFSKTNVMITIFAKTSSCLSKKANIFAKFFVENI
jgi:hypothetical protein